MKAIKKVSATPIDEITGSIVNGTNIEDKTKNTYSANTIDGLILEKYSTTEQVIGTYLGKPLYRKVVVINSESAIVDGLYLHEIENFGTLVNYGGSVYIQLGERFFQQPIPRLDIGNSADFGIGLGDVNDWGFRLQIGKAFILVSANVIFEYTKTTD